MGALLVMKILKSLYGPKQNPKNWYGTIDTLPVGIEFKVLKSNPCVYIFDGPTKMKQGLSMDEDSAVIATPYVYEVLLAEATRLHSILSREMR